MLHLCDQNFDNCSTYWVMLEFHNPKLGIVNHCTVGYPPKSIENLLEQIL